jgi:hypothetical protein
MNFRGSKVSNLVACRGSRGYSERLINRGKIHRVLGHFHRHLGIFQGTLGGHVVLLDPPAGGLSGL